MRQRIFFALALLALFTAPVLLAAEPETTAVAGPNSLLCDTAGEMSPLEGPASDLPGDLEAQLEGLKAKQDAHNNGNCWYEVSYSYPCSCGTKKRQLTYERSCCENGQCTGWVQTGNSCTPLPC